MGSMALTAQHISGQCGHLIWVEAVRTELGQTPFRPLQAYMKPEAVTEYLVPWQQIITFFARTQHPTEPSHVEYPIYRFNCPQRKAWDTLWDLAT